MNNSKKDSRINITLYQYAFSIKSVNSTASIQSWVGLLLRINTRIKIVIQKATIAKSKTRSIMIVRSKSLLRDLTFTIFLTIRIAKM